MAIRTVFPEKGSEYLNGTSDGWEYRTLFGGTSLKDSYQMLRQFLQEEGYKDVPLPKDEEELLRFKHPASKKPVMLFEKYGYIHNPIKIYFHPHLKKQNTLILCIYNEQVPQHLLKFHRKI